MGIIDEYAEFDTAANLKLKRRIKELNRPVNHNHKLPNNEKLTEPFFQLGISLSLKDIGIIEHRNDLLHGNILMVNDESLTDKEINAYMAFVTSKLYTLISKLILKNAGYRGYVINYAKRYETYAGNEEFFDLI